VLYSDLYGHREFVRGIVNASFSGLLWCPEVRDAVSEEDLIRRLETVVFSPLAMVNAWYIKNPPWKQIDRDKNNANDLAQNWQALETRCREIIGWRMQIVPYLRAAFWRYAKDGTPPFRALILDHPGQENLRTVDDEYMIGDRMIAAPLFAGEATRRVILPEGNWHDFWTGKAVTNDFTLPSSTRNIPLFVKAGSVLPLAKVAASAAVPESRDLVVQVYGDGSLPFTLSADDAQLELAWAAGKSSEQTSGERPYRVTDWKIV
jgi:alpha-D-xyloside xylohydrolase